MRKRARPITMAEETSEFKEFWAIWKPHMNPFDGRGDARDEFYRHVEELCIEPQDLVDGARWFIQSGGNQQRSYDGKLVQQHAKTWLNKRQYEDGADEWRSYQARQAERQVSNVVSMPGPRGQTAFLKSLKQSESA